MGDNNKYIIVEAIPTILYNFVGVPTAIRPRSKGLGAAETQLQ